MMLQEEASGDCHVQGSITQVPMYRTNDGCPVHPGGGGEVMDACSFRRRDARRTRDATKIKPSQLCAG